MAGLSEAEELELLELENANAHALGGSVMKDAPNDQKPGFIERNKGMISGLARPALETAGMMGGAALAGGGALATGPGALAAIPAATAGGALGFAGGKSAADLLDRALGVKAPLKNAVDALKETGGNIQDGAMAEAGGLAAGKALELGAQAGVWGGKKAMTAVLGPSAKDLEARFARNPEVLAAKPIDVLARELPNDANKLSKAVRDGIDKALNEPALAHIKKAKPIEVLARELPATVNELNKKVSELSGAALQTLKRSTSMAEGGITTGSIVRAIEEQRASLGDGVSEATAHANKILDRYIERLAPSKMAERLSEYEVGKFIRDFDNDINWGKPEMAPLNHALQGLRSTVDDALKTANPAYAAAMLPTAEATDVLVKARQLFSLKNDVGHGFVPGNNTATALKSAIGDARFDSQGVLEGLKKYTGRDFLSDVEHSLTAEKFKTNKGLDELLAEGDPRYSKALLPVAAGRDLLKKLQRIFNLQEELTGSLKTGDHTAVALKRAVEESHADSNDVLSALKRFSGRDYLRDIENSLTAEKFVGGKMNGSRRTVAMGAVGAKLGSMIGAPGTGGAAGALVGLHLDTEGHQIAGSIIDKLVRLSKRSRLPVPSEALQRAIGAAMAHKSEPPRRR